jgi:ABC-2 type transport system ATP-binding protein
VIVQAENISHRYGDRIALSGVSFEVPQGVVYGLLGPNGSGKSTLFRILSTLMAPTSGSARIAGFDIASQAAQVRRQIGVVFQSHSLDKKMSVIENLLAQGQLFGMSGNTLRSRADEAMTRLGLSDRRNDLTGELSGGLRRRVEIAKALLHRPKVMLMDEPSTGLDPVARRELWQFMADLRRQEEITVLVTTHFLEEADRCDTLLLIHEGKAVTRGTPAELKAKVGGDVVSFEVADPAAVQRDIKAKFGYDSTAANGVVRVEIANGHRFAAEAVEAFPGAIQSMAFHKPTIEDVFFDITGAKL